MSIYVQVEVECLPHDKWYGKVMPHAGLTMDVGGIVVHTKIIQNDRASSHYVPVEEIAVHVQEKDCDGRQTPDDGEVEEDRLAQTLTIDEHLWVVDFGLFVWLYIIAVHGWNVEGSG